MFRDDRQAGACCRALLARVNRGEWWGDDGRPTPEACELVEAGAGEVSAGERALLHLAFALWNGWEAGRLRELLSLDADNLAAVGELLTALALGPEAVDTWLDEHGGEEWAARAATARAQAAWREGRAAMGPRRREDWTPEALDAAAKAHRKWWSAEAEADAAWRRVKRAPGDEDPGR